MAGDLDMAWTAAYEGKSEPSVFHGGLTQTSKQEWLQKDVSSQAQPRMPHPYPTPDSGDGHFPDGTHFEPPANAHWGWQDSPGWQDGWDNWFFTKDPNYDLWNNPIKCEADNIAHRLDSGDSQGAADELASDLYALRGDRYAQDKLLSSVYNSEQKIVAADLELNNWDPDHGTWDTVEVWPNNGSQNIVIPIYDYNDAHPWTKPQV